MSNRETPGPTSCERPRTRDRLPSRSCIREKRQRRADLPLSMWKGVTTRTSAETSGSRTSGTLDEARHDARRLLPAEFGWKARPGRQRDQSANRRAAGCIASSQPALGTETIYATSPDDRIATRAIAPTARRSRSHSPNPIPLVDDRIAASIVPIPGAGQALRYESDPPRPSQITFPTETALERPARVLLVSPEDRSRSAGECRLATRRYCARGKSGDARFSARISTHRATQSLQIATPGPAMTSSTCGAVFEQNEQRREESGSARSTSVNRLRRTCLAGTNVTLPPASLPL
jgi:hypothetical protein